MSRHNLARPFLALIGLMIILVVLPFVIGPYYVYIVTALFINAILVVSFRFIALMGEWSFVHVALMGAGAYTCALLVARLGWPFWLTLPLGGLVAAAVAWVLSYPLLRMKGFYFFMGSFAAGEAIRLCWLRFEFFGSFRGIQNLPHPSLLGLNFGNLTNLYFLALAVALVCLLAMYRLENSRTGATLKSIAGQDFLAQSLGINILRYKTLALVTGSFFAGIAGVLLTAQMSSVSPYQFVFSYNLKVIVWTILGGLGGFAGPLIGLATMTGIEQGVRAFGGLEKFAPVIYGIVLILVMLFMSGGLLSLRERISPLVQRLRMRLRGKSIS